MLVPDDLVSLISGCIILRSFEGLMNVAVGVTVDVAAISANVRDVNIISVRVSRDHVATVCAAFIIVDIASTDAAVDGVVTLAVVDVGVVEDGVVTVAVGCHLVATSLRVGNHIRFIDDPRTDNAATVVSLGEEDIPILLAA